MEEEVEQFFSQKENLRSRVLDSDGKIICLLITKSPLTLKDKNSIVLSHLGVSYTKIDYISAIDPEELKRVAKLAELHMAQRKVKELEEDLLKD